MWDFYFQKYYYTCTKQNILKREIEMKSQEKQSKRRVPVPPTYRMKKTNYTYIKKCQRYISSLTYNMIGFQLFYIDKTAPLLVLLKTAKDMIQYSVPIKCLEAVILGIYLTRDVSKLDRFTLTFKSKQNGLTYYHTLLGLHYYGKYGAMGLSRKSNLMDRDFEFDNLSSMICSFRDAYREHNHTLVKVSIGDVIPHDSCTMEKINWCKTELHLKDDNNLHVVGSRSSYIRCRSKL